MPSLVVKLNLKGRLCMVRAAGFAVLRCSMWTADVDGALTILGSCACIPYTCAMKAFLYW